MVLVVVSSLGGCISDLSISDDDCDGRVRYDAVIYQPNGDLNKAAPKGGELGTADIIDCGDVDSASKVDEVTVSSVKGVATSVAVIVEQGEWHGIYVAQDVPRSEWPRVLLTR